MAIVIQYEIDGITHYAHDVTTFNEYLAYHGIDKDVVRGMFYDEIAEEVEDQLYDDLSHGRRELPVDGMIGDRFFNYQYAIRSEVDDLENDIYESLLSNSRKGNTKADIARRLKNIIDNLHDYVG